MIAIQANAIVWPKLVLMCCCFIAFAESMEAFDAAVTIDAREHSLIELFKEHGFSGHIVRPLPLGTVQCTYADGTGWLLERRTAASLKMPLKNLVQIFEEGSFLRETGFRAVIVIEGDMRQSSMHGWLLSAMAGIEHGDCAQGYSTWDTFETFNFIGMFIRKLKPPPPDAAPPKTTTSKRKRESSPSIALKRMLMCYKRSRNRK